MAEVGYLIGAGASADCIPVVKKMAESKENGIYKKFTDAWGTEYRQFDISGIGTIDSYSMQEECKKIIDKIEKYSNSHSSIDTYAKKLYLSQNMSGYRLLKVEMSFYFTLIQILNPPDKRYDNFWASILNSQELPKAISIFSWNYDFQFELTYKEFAGLNGITDVWEKLNINSPSSIMQEENKDKFHFTKLNGSARFRDNGTKSGRGFCEFNDFEIKNNLANLFKSYYLAKNSNNDEIINELSFAWEGASRSFLLESIQSVLSKIKELVIIGYSFPFFNRKVDERLFEGMTSLNRIIIQDYKHEWIKDRLEEFIFKNKFSKFRNKSSLTIEFREVSDQFFFPSGLEV